ncbi:hypothetical protein WICPIJ_000991 [Wickerhamomyces pijperi]|uniref:Uncharacterized protein n=1 Tax=Wickerhamomyces pijperi TaxID=599730 RepID=A0A9P8QCE1_WICPI|nr:hypothetical protein WICPIJ_000991 [Wickerhamomyces pijperi]
MKYKNLVAITLDPEASLLRPEGDGHNEDEEEIEICEYLPSESQLKKIPNFLSKFAKFLDSDLVELFFNSSLPFISLDDVNPFDLFDAETKVFNHRTYQIKDGILERDVEVPNDIGRRVNRLNIEAKDEHFYLPGLPSLVYEEYPCFKPSVDLSTELTNAQMYEQYVKPFNKIWRASLAKSSVLALGNLRDIILYQTPVSQANYFSFSIYEFADVFQNKIFEPLITIFNEVLYSTDDLKQFFKKDEVSDDYKPVLSSDCYVSLKPIGSCAESPFAFGIQDEETGLLNMLFVHLEFCNLCLDVAEGYELYFQTKKRNFKDSQMTGSEKTKMTNFLKKFTKCVSICLNSKTNRFIITDYNWTGIFEIEDCMDGEIQDVNKFISQVKVKHFGFFNFEKDKHLSTRNIIGAFCYTTPKQHKSTVKKMDKLNTRISEEWEAFLANKTNFITHTAQSTQPPRKKLKQSPFIFRTLDGMPFTSQKVDLLGSLINFTAIGTQWSCQTLLVDLKKLYLDPNYTPQNVTLSHTNSTSPVLLSVYDEYYQDPALSMLFRHLNNSNLKCGSTKSLENAQQVFTRWLSNLDSYNKLRSLQGEVIAKVLDYGYLEDKPRNDGPGTHFKTDGYYIIYEPICNPDEELTVLDPKNQRHYEIALHSLAQLHMAGVSFAPTSTLIPEVFKVYNDKAYIINLEDTNSMVISINHIKKDVLELDKFFGKKTDLVGHLKKYEHPLAEHYATQLQELEAKGNNGSGAGKSGRNNHGHGHHRRRSSAAATASELIQGLDSLVAESRRRGSRSRNSRAGSVSRSRRGSAAIVDIEALRGLAGRMNEGDFLVMESDDEEY